jgi:hypothetical protein
LKGAPFGLVEESEILKHKISVVANEIKGIIYYIDNENNVYNTEDIIQNKENPRIIAKATLENGEYHIPFLNI